MSDDAERQAMNVTPPTASNTPGEGVTCLSANTSAQVADLYDSNGNPYRGYYDRYVTLEADGDSVYVAFSNAATPLIDDTVSGTANVAAGTTTAVPLKIPKDSGKDFRLETNTHRYLHYKGASACTLRIAPSSQKLPSKS